MARNKTILQNKFPYHITGRCINREWFNIPMEVVWDIFCEELHMTSIMYNLNIHSFVLMSNHYHLIASTPDSNLSKCMLRFSQRVSRRLTSLSNRINQTFAGRYFKSILDQPSYYLNAYKYNYRNPVEAGLCEKVQDYPFSSLNSLLGGSRLKTPILHDDTLFPDTESTLDWLNEKPKLQKRKAVQFALRKSYFKFEHNKRSKHYMDKKDII